MNKACTEITTEIVETSVYDYHFCYNYNNSEIDSVIIGNEDVEVERQLSNVIQFRDS